MSDFVDLADLKTYLGDAPASSDDALLQDLLDEIEALFLNECGRSESTAPGDVVEVLDGTGTSELYLEFPIAEDGLTSIKLGYNVRLARRDARGQLIGAVLVYGEGSRVVRRTDGGTFGRGGEPRYVTVEYEHQGDEVIGAELAIKRACALVYRQRGSEDVADESVGSFYSRTMAKFGRDFVGDDPIWRMAVAANAVSDVGIV
jgi:hypothetical protein